MAEEWCSKCLKMAWNSAILEECSTPICGRRPKLAQIIYAIGGTCGGVKQGRFVVLRFPLFRSVWRSQDNHMLRQKRQWWKMSLSHPVCVPQILVKTRISEQYPQILVEPKQNSSRLAGLWHVWPYRQEDTQTGGRSHAVQIANLASQLGHRLLHWGTCHWGGGGWNRSWCWEVC